MDKKKKTFLLSLTMDSVLFLRKLIPWVPLRPFHLVCLVLLLETKAMKRTNCHYTVYSEHPAATERHPRLRFQVAGSYLDSEWSSADCLARCSGQSAESVSAVDPHRETFRCC